MKYLLLLLLVISSTPLNAETQPLADFRRVVIPDDALSVQKEAANELAH